MEADHYAIPLTAGYPQAIDETDIGFTLRVNGSETGTIRYAIFPGNFSSPVTHEAILNGTGAVTHANFLMNTASTDISEVISTLTASTTYDVYLFLEDNAGNQGEIYHINDVTTLVGPDTEAPAITCPANQELACSATTIPDYTSLATVTDNEDPNPVITQIPMAGTAFTDGMAITLTATDASSNASNCTFIVNQLADTEAPVIACPAAQSLAFGAIIPDYTPLATATDNCDANPTITQSPIVGTAFTDGMTITLTATDASNNTSNCTFVVNQLLDTEVPAITCPANQELACSATTIPDYTSLATVTDNEDPNPVITQSPMAGTAFTDGMTITLTATDASNNASTCEFTVAIGEAASVEAGEDVTILQGESTQLHANSTMEGVYNWSPFISLDASDIASPIANPELTTTYEVVFTSNEGCIAQDEVTVFVEETEGIHTTKYGFSPDNDGVNEFWKINEIENYPINKVVIYNRWNDKVFEISGYDNKSHVFNGEANRMTSLGAGSLPVGTYFFKIELDKGIEVITGYIVLKR